MAGAGLALCAPGAAYWGANVMPMLDTKAPTHYRWEDMTAEKLKGSITRRLITGDSMMIAEVRLAKGELVPKHAHHNEQITYITSGALHFKLGEDGEREVTVRAGEVLVIPSNVPHSALALEDTVDIDVFSPPREDWLDGSDAYLRGGG
jgi:quercetin dioxygenase-like cupin family protein